MTVSTERAVLAGGLFLGHAGSDRRICPGVISTRVGYSGGDVQNATYRNHGNHAEAIEIVFDPKMISFRNLLEFFFQIHDPTTRTARATTSAPAIARRSSTPATNRSGSRRTRSPMSSLRPVAGQGCDRSGAGPAVLGGRARASGLSGALSRRLHLPFRPARLETAAAQGWITPEDNSRARRKGRTTGFRGDTR